MLFILFVILAASAVVGFVINIAAAFVTMIGIKGLPAFILVFFIVAIVLAVIATVWKPKGTYKDF